MHNDVIPALVIQQVRPPRRHRHRQPTCLCVFEEEHVNVAVAVQVLVVEPNGNLPRQKLVNVLQPRPVRLHISGGRESVSRNEQPQTQRVNTAALSVQCNTQTYLRSITDMQQASLPSVIVPYGT